MRQILFQIGPFAVPAYGLFLAMASILGMHLAERRGRRLGVRPFALFDATFVAVLASIVGASWLFPVFGGSGLTASADWSQRASFGGFTAGLIAAIAFLLLARIPVLTALDAAFLYLPLSFAVGRLGCWYYGCCYGRVCSPQFPLSVSFPKVTSASGELAGSPAYLDHLARNLITSDASRSLTVFPSQLFAAASQAVVFVVLLGLADRRQVRRIPGSLFCVSLWLLCSARFVEEMFRGDNIRYLNLFSAQQITCVVLMLGTLMLYVFLRRGGGLQGRQL